jgi:hypothetical protein
MANNLFTVLRNYLTEIRFDQGIGLGGFDAFTVRYEVTRGIRSTSSVYYDDFLIVVLNDHAISLAQGRPVIGVRQECNRLQTPIRLPI